MIGASKEQSRRYAALLHPYPAPIAAKLGWLSVGRRSDRDGERPRIAWTVGTRDPRGRQPRAHDLCGLRLYPVRQSQDRRRFGAALGRADPLMPARDRAALWLLDLARRLSRTQRIRELGCRARGLGGGARADRDRGAARDL